MEIINLPDTLKEITKKTVVIVQFKIALMPTDVSPGKFFQVTVDPGKLSPSGKFIRFGANPGDELVGWQPVEWMVIADILGEWTDDQPPQLEYKAQEGVTMLIGDK